MRRRRENRTAAGRGSGGAGRMRRKLAAVLLAVFCLGAVSAPAARAARRYTDADAKMIARVIWGEARGIKSQTERACIAWTILNRVDHYGWPIQKTITMRGQFYYSAKFPVTKENLWLAKDVLGRWSREKAGAQGTGRVLPKGYMWYAGNGRHNIFRNRYRGGTRWNYSLKSPYRS